MLPARSPGGPMRSDALPARTTTIRDLTLFLLMLDGGPRPGEVLCLQLDNVSDGRRRATIPYSGPHRDPQWSRQRVRRTRSWCWLSVSGGRGQS